MATGKQWVAMSLYAIVYNEIKSVNIWDQSILNTILMNGNSLYSVIGQGIHKNYLLLTDVPELVDIDKWAFNFNAVIPFQEHYISGKSPSICES